LEIPFYSSISEYLKAKKGLILFPILTLVLIVFAIVFYIQDDEMPLAIFIIPSIPGIYTAIIFWTIKNRFKCKGITFYKSKVYLPVKKSLMDKPAYLVDYENIYRITKYNRGEPEGRGLYHIEIAFINDKSDHKTSFLGLGQMSEDNYELAWKEFKSRVDLPRNLNMPEPDESYEIPDINTRFVQKD
jgi:hypothetical protein